MRLSRLFPATGHDIVAGFALRSPFFFGLDRTLGALAEDKLPPRDGSPVDERGSNAFAVAGRRSSDGVTRLISNSHQPWTGGVAWYEVVLHSDAGWDFAGALFPGAPFGLVGRTPTLGWTNTVNRGDLIDTYKLVRDGDGTHYRYDGQWLPLESHRVWLRVKVGPFVLPVPKTIARARQGPVVTNRLGSFAVRYAGFGDVRQIEQYYRLNRARTFSDWRAAMAMQAVPATNFIYADAAGHIAYIYNEKFPHRAPGFDWRGVLPGDTSRDVWTSYEPASADPTYIDPPSGWLANSNNTPFVATGAGDNLDPSAFSPLLGIETYMTNRAHRFRDLFAALGSARIGRDDLLRIKFDTGYSRSGWAGTWLARIAAVPAKGDKDVAAAQALLATWDWTLDGTGRADALALYLLSAASGQGYRGDPLPDATTALREVVREMLASFHRLDPPLGDVQRLRRGTADLPLSGGPDALRAVYSHIDPASGKRVGFDGDSFVMLTEWGPQGVKSLTIQPFGSAIERPAARHYSDQAPLFAAEKWKPVRDTDAALAGHVERDYRVD